MSLEIYIRENKTGYGSWINSQNDTEDTLDYFKEELLEKIEDPEILETIEDTEPLDLDIEIEDVELDINSKYLSTTEYGFHNMTIERLINIDTKLEELGSDIITKIEVYKENINSDMCLSADLLEDIDSEVTILEQELSFSNEYQIIGDYLIRTYGLEIPQDQWHIYIEEEHFNKDMGVSSDLDCEAMDMLEDFDYETVKGYFDMELVGKNIGNEYPYYVFRHQAGHYSLVEINR
jgi:hypothetical protein